MSNASTQELSHIGIRVSTLERSLQFYAALGFCHVSGPFEGEPVVILRNAANAELNLIVNAPESAAANVLMDLELKHAGITHAAFWVADLDATRETLRAQGIHSRGEPVVFPNGVRAIFIRDPDLNVIELDERPLAGQIQHS